MAINTIEQAHEEKTVGLHKLTLGLQFGSGF